MKETNYHIAYAKLLELGLATASELSDALGYSKTKTGNLISRLSKMGCVQKAGKKQWQALADRPPAHLKRGRPASTEATKKIVLETLGHLGQAKLSSLIDAAKIQFPEGGRDARSAIVSALASLCEAGHVVHSGTRGSYMYELAGRSTSKENAA